VFFGSALRNFGVGDLLEGLAAFAPPPRAQAADTRRVEADEPRMTAFVFKIQANMDPNHRDRIAFARLCSGKLVRGMKAKLVRTGKPMGLHTPHFLIDNGVQLVAPHRLSNVLRHGPLPSGYVILGGGKTGMDVAYWLLTTGVPPEAITWIRPRDAWLINRRAVQPAMEFFEECIGAQAAQVEAYAEATDVEDLFDRLEHAGVMLRIDRSVRPQMMHFATISTREIEVLHTIKNVIRRGRVRRIRAHSIEFADGDEPMCGSPMYIDCTASAAVPCPVQPVFQGDRIILQYIQSPRTSLSAAMIAFVEAHKHDDAIKNALCEPVSMSDTVADYVPLILGNMVNQQRQAHDSDLRRWLRTSRLDGFSGLMAAVDPADAAKLAIVQRIREAAPNAFANLTRIRDRDQAAVL
jgi:hypothetical protein